MELCIWQQLPPDLQARILGFLPPNEIACTARFLNKSAAAYLSGPEQKRVRLSQPVPHHAFVRRWGPASQAARRMGFYDREQLACLTASSGSLENLEVAMDSCGLFVKYRILEAAAAAGHVHIVQRLRQQGCPWGASFDRAALAGRSEMCEWLLANGCDTNAGVACAAARGGHVDLVGRLLALLPPDDPALEILAAVAEGCDLPTLQRTYAAWRARHQQGGDHHYHHHHHQQDQQDQQTQQVQEQQEDLPPQQQLVLQEQGLTDWHKDIILAAAAFSPTPDWQAKVEWVQSTLGVADRPQEPDYRAAVSLPDLVDRLRWLRHRGFQVGVDAVFYAARIGRTELVECLLTEFGVSPEYCDYAVEAALEAGHLATLQVLHARGCTVDSRAARVAAKARGHDAMLAWLEANVPLEGGAEGPQLGVQLAQSDEALMQSAAAAGKVEVLAELRGRGCAWAENTMTCAVGGGCEEAVEWLLERGSPLGDLDNVYLPLLVRGDLAVLRCLRRHGCPWPSPRTFVCCLRNGAPPGALAWLLAEGCPVDWDAALTQAAQRRGWSADWRALDEWLRGEHERWRERL